MPMMLPETYVGTHPNNGAHVWRPLGTMGRTQPDYGIGIDLRNARQKIATGSLTNTYDVQHMNEGRHDGMPKFCVQRELTLMSIVLAEFP
jgi:hypothetical protein